VYASVLKVKLVTTVIAISSIHLLLQPITIKSTVLADLNPHGLFIFHNANSRL